MKELGGILGNVFSYVIRLFKRRKQNNGVEEIHLIQESYVC